MASLEEQRTSDLRTFALDLGFSAVGFAPADLVTHASRFHRWLRKGCHAGMDYMTGYPEKRLDPRELLPGAKSVMAVALAYRHPRPLPPEGVRTGKVSCYAWGRNYHRVLGKRLMKVKNRILSEHPDASVYYSIDAGPVLERYWAWKAGLGWIGKSGNLIHPKLGSFLFLGVLITDVEFAYDQPQPSQCGTCELCIRSCPTGAIIEPGMVDARRCLSYWTVEHRGEIPAGIAEKMPPRVFGCDVCQEVCPWNREAPFSEDPQLAPRLRIANPELEWLENLTEKEFAAYFHGTPMTRVGVAGLRRNAICLLEL